MYDQFVTADETYIAEYKLDGERLMLHWKRGAGHGESRAPMLRAKSEAALKKGNGKLAPLQAPSKLLNVENPSPGPTGCTAQHSLRCGFALQCLSHIQHTFKATPSGTHTTPKTLHTSRDALA